MNEDSTVRADPDVVAFVNDCVRLVDCEHPAAHLIFGHFSDESEDHYRLSIIDREAQEKLLNSGAQCFDLPGMVPLIVEQRFLNVVLGSRIVLRGSDTVDFVRAA